MRCLRDETEVGDAALVAYEPFLRREHALEHAEDTQDLLLVAFNGTRNLLGRKEHEPARLAEVRALAGRLEEEPLELREALRLRRGRDRVRRVVLRGEVQDDRVGLPKNKGTASERCRER